MSYMLDLRNNKAEISDIDKYIDNYRNNPPTGIRLYEYLGMSKSEFLEYSQNPTNQTLYRIFKSREVIDRL